MDFHKLPNCMFIRVFEKFHPTCLLGPTRLLDIMNFSIQHVYLDYTFIRNTRVVIENHIITLSNSFKLEKNSFSIPLILLDAATLKCNISPYA